MVKISLDSKRVPKEALSHLAWNDPSGFDNKFTQEMS